MTRKICAYALLLLTIVMSEGGCGNNTAKDGADTGTTLDTGSSTTSAAGDTGSNSDGDADTETNTGSDTDTRPGQDTNSDIATDTSTHSGAVFPTDSDTDTPMDTDLPTDVPPDPDSETAPINDTDDTETLDITDTDSDTASAPDAGDTGGVDTESEGGSDTDAGALSQVDNLTIQITGSPATANDIDGVTVLVTAFDTEGRPVPAAEISDLSVIRGFEPGPLDYEALGDGTFTTTLTASGAGETIIYAREVEGNEATARAVFLPDLPTVIDILDIPMATVAPDGSRDLRTTATILLRDDFGNPVATEPDNIEVTSDAGSVSAVTLDPDHPYYRVEITSPVYDKGTLTVRYAADLPSPLEATAPIFFPPAIVRTGGPDTNLPGIEEGGTVDVYFELNVPGGIEPIYYFDAWISFDAIVLQYNGPTAIGEDCTMDYAISYGYDLNFGGTCPDFTGSTIPIRFEFQPLNADFEDTLVLEDLLYTDASYTPVSPDDFATEWPPHLFYPLVTKSRVSLPVHIWAQPGHVAPEEIQADIDRANELLALNAARCACGVFYTVEPTITIMTAGQWRGLSGADLELEYGERRDVGGANGGNTYDESVHNVYYGAITAEDVKGVFDPDGPAAFVDNSNDPDNLIFTHVLGHLVSGGILDSFDDTNGQGGREPGNLYNHNDMGDHLTTEQCGLIGQ